MYYFVRKGGILFNFCRLMPEYGEVTRIVCIFAPKFNVTKVHIKSV